MIKRLSHSTIYVIDQQEPLEFYRDTLGFEVNTDMPMGDSGPRWLMVSPKGQLDLEPVLAELTPGPMFDAETAEGIRSLVEKGAFGIGVFETDNIHGDYERLTAPFIVAAPERDSRSER